MSKKEKPSIPRMNLYLPETAQHKIRALAAFIEGKNVRSSDSKIIQAALMLAEPGSKFLAAFEKVRESDKRYNK